METSWERPQDFERLGLAEIAALLRPHGLTPRDAELLTEGKANTNYRVRLDDGRSVVLRLHQRAPETAALEAALAEQLHGLVPVPRWIVRAGEQPLSVLEWLPGASMERVLQEGDLDAVVRAAPDLGRAHAAISSIHFPAAGFLDGEMKVREPWPSAVEGLLSYLRHLIALPRLVERLSPALTTAVARIADEAEPRLREEEGTPCLVHGDYKLSNLLLDDGRLSGVLDWEFAHVGHWLFGVGQLFRHPLPDGFAEGFVAGVAEAGRPLPPDWRRLAAALDMVNLADFAAREASGEQTVAGSRERLEETVRRWEAAP
jgi:aminoglycoside phosphotransferase (APT) family kinase protein